MYIRYLENGKHSSFMDDMKKNPTFWLFVYKEILLFEGFPLPTNESPDDRFTK